VALSSQFVDTSHNGYWDRFRVESQAVAKAITPLPTINEFQVTTAEKIVACTLL
jgi:hypothetical protein